MSHFLAREFSPGVFSGFGEPTNGVLDHDDRAINDESEIDGPQAHEIARDAKPIHPNDGNEHGERDGEGDDDGAAQVAKEQE